MDATEGAMIDVLCFGNLQFDVLCRPLAGPLAPGELREIDAIDFALSGNGGNVAAALARLGIAAGLAGYSGADAVGEGFRATLEGLGVHTSRLLRHPSAGTGTSVIAVASSGERSVLFVNGANADFSLNDVPDDWLAGLRVLSVGSVFVLPQFTGEAVGRLFARARGRGVRTVLNICWDGRGQGLTMLAPALAASDCFVLSRDEGRQLTGEDTPARILAALRSYTPGIAILTLGAEGCCLSADGECSHVPAVPVRALDCTGAGDTFVAGLIAGLVTNRSVADSARLGCATASYAVTGPGAYPRIPPLAEVERLAFGRKPTPLP